jgi:single-stranded DNA-binding protein
MHRNEVMLVGRLSMEPVGRELPSGSLLTQWRLAVRRPEDHPGRQRSDAIECATFDDEVRGMVADWLVDDVIEVQGALRRRWWRGGSRYEVEVRTARRVAREPDGPADQADQADRVDQLKRADQNERADPKEAEATRRPGKGSRRRPV